jgi:hypothetical protein
MLAQGSGIFINIGKSLKIKGDWSKDIKQSFGMLFKEINKSNGCITYDTSSNCHDKYYCTVALKLGYDSIQTYGNNEIIICSHNCSVMPIVGTCPPIEMRTSYDASIACTCNDDYPILNCNETMISKKHNFTTQSIVSRYMNENNNNNNNNNNKSNDGNDSSISNNKSIDHIISYHSRANHFKYRPYSCVSSFSSSSPSSTSPSSISLHTTIVYRNYESIISRRKHKHVKSRIDREDLQRLVDLVEKDLRDIPFKEAMMIPLTENNNNNNNYQVNNNNTMNIIVLIDKRYDVIIIPTNQSSININDHHHHEHNHDVSHHKLTPSHHAIIKHTFYITMLTRTNTASFHHINFNPSISSTFGDEVLNVMDHHSINHIALTDMTPVKVSIHTKTSDDVYERFKSLILNIVTLNSIVINIGVITYNTKYEMYYRLYKKWNRNDDHHVVSSNYSGDSQYPSRNLYMNNPSDTAMSSHNYTYNDDGDDDDDTDDEMMMVVRHLIDESSCLREAGAHFVVLLVEEIHGDDDDDDDDIDLTDHTDQLRHSHHDHDRSDHISSDTHSTNKNNNNNHSSRFSNSMMMSLIVHHTKSYIDVILSTDTPSSSSIPSSSRSTSSSSSSSSRQSTASSSSRSTSSSSSQSTSSSSSLSHLRQSSTSSRRSSSSLSRRSPSVEKQWRNSSSTHYVHHDDSHVSSVVYMHRLDNTVHVHIMKKP